MFARSHNERQACKLRSALINLKTDHVILQNQLRYFMLAVAALFVHGKEQIKCINQHATRATCWVAQRYFLRIGNMDEVPILVFRFNIKF